MKQTGQLYKDLEALDTLPPKLRAYLHRRLGEQFNAVVNFKDRRIDGPNTAQMAARRVIDEINDKRAAGQPVGRRAIRKVINATAEILRADIEQDQTDRKKYREPLYPGARGRLFLPRDLEIAGYTYL